MSICVIIILYYFVKLNVRLLYSTVYIYKVVIVVYTNHLLLLLYYYNTCYDFPDIIY